MLARLALAAGRPSATAAAGCVAAWLAPTLVAPRLVPAATSAASFPLSAGPSWTPVRHATSKAGGSTKNGRDSQPKYLGVKKYGGHFVEPGNIILRQRGQKYGIVDSTQTVAFGKDWTIYAIKPGYVKFWFHAMKKKYYVEVVQSPPGDTNVVKYPIVRIKDWEVPELLKVPADTVIIPPIRQKLVDWLRTIPPSELAKTLPRNTPFVGGVEAEFWGPAAKAAKAAAAAAAAPAEAPAAPAAPLSAATAAATA